MAAGVFRREKNHPEIAIICVDKRRRWRLPKRLVDPGEQPEQAAIRE
ncbi:MAG TPA: NUDIX domain-containing protein, partial [Gammaproteobacteria bacterium]|nr:NUDIX domain-containing protein [Gammaproteobacteria bacterium]